MRFSQRHGYTTARKAVQFESMDRDLRTRLWNAIYEIYVGPLHSTDLFRDPYARLICADLWSEFFKLPLDQFNARQPEGLFDRLKKLIYDGEWFEVYDVIEFIATRDIYASTPPEYRGRINASLERESAAYRFVGEHIAPITGQVELDEIGTALDGVSGAVSQQLEKALQLLSDRKDRDYHNSIKESISAVEGQVKITLERDKGTLGELLKHVEQKAPLHPALKDAFSRLYGYTSDEGGIRHALMDDSRAVTFEEAKFMLVACSAFINYVRGVTKS